MIHGDEKCRHMMASKQGIDSHVCLLWGEYANGFPIQTPEMRSFNIQFNFQSEKAGE